MESEGARCRYFSWSSQGGCPREADSGLGSRVKVGGEETTNQETQRKVLAYSRCLVILTESEYRLSKGSSPLLPETGLEGEGLTGPQVDASRDRCALNGLPQALQTPASPLGGVPKNHGSMAIPWREGELLKTKWTVTVLSLQPAGCSDHDTQNICPENAPWIYVTMFQETRPGEFLSTVPWVRCKPRPGRGLTNIPSRIQSPPVLPFAPGRPGVLSLDHCRLRNGRKGSRRWWGQLLCAGLLAGRWGPSHTALSPG